MGFLQVHLFPSVSPKYLKCQNCLSLQYVLTVHLIVQLSMQLTLVQSLAVYNPLNTNGSELQEQRQEESASTVVQPSPSQNNPMQKTKVKK